MRDDSMLNRGSLSLPAQTGKIIRSLPHQMTIENKDKYTKGSLVLVRFTQPAYHIIATLRQSGFDDWRGRLS